MGRLQPGINDLYTWCIENGDFGQQLINEWTGEDEIGNDVDIHYISRGSHAKVTWKCSKCGEEWTTAILHRTKDKRGCPYCYNKRRSEIAKKNNEKRTKRNSLYDWCIDNGEFGQQLLREWQGKDSNDNIIDIHDISAKNPLSVKWKCAKCNNEWSTKIWHRTAHNTQCPLCSKQGTSERARLATVKIGANDLYSYCKSLGDEGDIILAEWYGEDENGNKIEPTQITVGSGIPVKWKCHICGNIYIANTFNKLHGLRGCGKCEIIERNKNIQESRTITGENDLLTYCNNNGSWGELLKKEWVSNITNNHSIDKTAQFSADIVKWKCIHCGKEWQTYLYTRTKNMTGCPHCNVNGTSYPEQFLYRALKQIFKDAESRCKVLKTKENPQGIEFDIGIPSERTCIEYSPTYWHSDKIDKDNNKIQLCKEYNVRLIYIQEDSYKEYDEAWDKNYICFNMRSYNRDDILEKILKHIVESLDHSITEINIDKAKQEAYDFMHRSTESENQLS